MTNIVGGLYKQEESAIDAVQALQGAGFQEGDITLLVRRRVTAPEFESRASVRDVARNAGLGAILLGLIGAVLAYLVGVGMIQVSGLFPNFESGDSGMILALTIHTFLVSAVTGAILAAALTLAFSSEKAEITPRGVKRGGLLVVVNVDDSQGRKAQNVMEEHGAVDIENLSEELNPDVWTRYKGVQVPSE